MNIGINVDGFLINLSKFQLENGKKFFNDNHYVNGYAYKFREMFNCSQKEEKNFWSKNIWKYSLRAECEKGASDTINKLKADGNKIYIFSSRIGAMQNNISGDITRKMLTNWLKKNNIPYDSIIYYNNENSAKEKYEACLKLNINFMCEDQINNAIAMSEISNVILIDRPYNHGFKTNGIYRITNISEVYNILSGNSKRM